MTDRELLELAAKALGGQARFDLSPDGAPWLQNVLAGRPQPYPVRWNPLTDDGDAFRLAVKLGLVVDCSRPSAGEPWEQHTIWLDELMSTEELTRRAIVRAAAEIGRGK